MAASRTSFAKLQRDRAKKAKAAAKRERRLERAEAPEAGPEPSTGVGEGGEELSAAELLRMVEQLHADFEAKRIDFETFEERKTELFARLSVD